MKIENQPHTDNFEKAIFFSLSAIFLAAFMFASTHAANADNANGSQSAANNITVADAVTPPGYSVVIPITVAAATDIAGVNIRVEYDPNIFSAPIIDRGSLLEGKHLLFSDSPQPGRLCAAAYSFDASPFTTLNGTVFTLSLYVVPTAPDGDYTVSFSTGGNLPSSGLCDLAGNRLEHTQTGGTITVDASAIPGMPYDIDRNGIVDETDLMLFCRDWIHSPTSTRCDFDKKGSVNELDLFMFSAWWSYNYQ
jgi:Cohesin domain